MALGPGTRVGPYEIVGALGSGGMGEVYRATDTKLVRQVAIKVLPEAFAQDADRLLRFEREARTLAALNHPNIAHIHGLEESDGRHALVMELVEGPTLADRIAQGPIPVDEALAIARQIAEALEAAHEQGIIHRDLKPANIKVRADGTVKVLDFGLAKAMEPTGSMLPSASMSPTITSPAMTQAGIILGTAAYMSPEQARGKPVDKRADVWAFGCVVYEMLTGKRAFDAEDVSLTLAEVMKSDPDWKALPPLPSPGEMFLRQCLKKDPRQRVRDIHVVRLALEGAFEGVVAQRSDVVAPRSASSRVWMAAAVLGVAAAIAVSVIHFREAPPHQPTLRYQIPVPEKEATTSFALSPNGQQLAFTTGVIGQPAAGRLWVRPLNSLEARPLRGTEGASHAFWSPDSRTIAFFADGKIKKIDSLGGPPQTVCAAPFGNLLPNAGTWNREGVVLFTGAKGLVHQASASDAEGHPITLALDASRQEIIHLWPHFLPDGRHFLYTAVSSVAGNSAVYAASLDSQESKRLLASDANAAYTQDATGQGYMLFLREETLLAQRFDAARLELLGEPFPVAESVGAFAANPTGTARGLRAQFSSSASGILSYRSGRATAKELVWLNRAGQRLSRVGEPADYSNLALAPDEGRLAISRMDPQLASRDIWIFDLDRGVPTKFTFDRGDDMNPVWSPDGTRIAFSSSRKGQRDLYVKDANGTGEDQLLFASDELKSMADWSRDGRYVLFNAFALPLDGERKPIPLPQGSGTPRISPNGRWLAYQSGESGSLEIYVQSFPELVAGRSPGKRLVSTAGGRNAEWRRDGQEIFYLAPDDTLMAVSVTASGPAFETGLPKPLFPLRIEPASRRAHYQPAANGQRFLVVQLLEQVTPNPITVVVNWAADLTR